MDRVVTVRFYEIGHPHPTSSRFEDILRDIAAKEMRDREGALDEGQVVLRLEHLEEIDGLLIGDMTRVQSRNLPGHVLDDGVARLPVDEIGHSCLFVYDPGTGCLAFQFDIRMGVGRLTRYLRQFADDADFRQLPYLKADTLARFREETPVRLRLKVARVRNFRDIPAGKTDFEDQLEDFSEMFDAPSIELIMSTRGEGRQLNGAQVWNTIRRWIDFRENVDGIKAIEAKTLESDKAFDFIKDLLCETDTLDLPDNDPLASRSVRKAFVRQCYEQHREYIGRVSGAI